MYCNSIFRQLKTRVFKECYVRKCERNIHFIFFNSEFQTFKVAFFQTVKLEFPNLIFLLSKIPNLKFEFSRLKLKIPTSKLKNQMKVGNSKN